MTTRTEWVRLKQNLSKIKVDITDIHNAAETFFNYINIDSFEKKDTIKIFPSLMKAESAVNSAKRLLKNYIDPEQNELVAKETTNYDWFVDNLGRADLNIRSDRDKLISSKEYNRDDIPLKTMAYKNMIIDNMNHLVFYPLKNAHWKYTHEEFKESVDKERKVEKDLELFWYLVFKEYFHSSESLGALAGQEVRTIPSTFGVVSHKPTRQRKLFRSKGYQESEEVSSEEGQEEEQPPIEDYSEPLEFEELEHEIS